jgi:ATP-binding cassette subfamily F protein uup
MNYLSVENLTKSYGDRILFADLTFGIDNGQKVAIVAKNGNGKTTLLRCLMGLEAYDNGNIVYRKDIRVAYMQQTDLLDDNQSILDAVLSHDSPQLRIVKKYNEALASGIHENVESCYEEMTEFQAWDTEVQVNQMLSKLKLHDTSAKINSLSGGQKKRVALAQVLLADADLLFLDEPTNHLDLDMIEWLEDYLSKSKATIIMVTHDRYFLEVVCDTILELEDKTLHRYKGNFSYYLEKKSERQEQQQATIDKARNTFKKELDWIRRQPKARGTKQKARIDAFQETKKIASQRIEEDEMDIPVKMERLGTKIVEMHKVSKSFASKTILNGFNYNFQRKERLGIVGANGTGKSTFLNILQGHMQPDQGKIVIGETVVFGYYSQELIQVDDDKKVIDVIRDIAEFIPLEKGRQLSAAQFLEKFLFDRSMHYNFVHKLSGGEKRRLKLMTVLMSNPNFLILDEPTNDLDIFVMSVLEEYLRTFQGCLIVVSHDRYFMDKMVDHLFVFEGEGQIKDIIGNYTAFRQLEKNALKNAEPAPLKQVEVKVESKPVEKRKLSFKEKEEFNLLERDMEQLEHEKLQLTEEMSKHSINNEDLMRIGNRMAEIVSELEVLSDRWLELAEFI